MADKYGKRDEMGGREVPSPKMKEYERANPRSTTGGAMGGQDWDRVPKPPPGTPGMSGAEIDKFYRDNPVNKMSKGGKVGSPTCCVPKYKHK
jgi:hypothetical protein